MRRREFITSFGSTVVAWPLAARAQQPAMPVIGYLGPGSAQSDAFRVTGFRQGLKEAGYVEGQNLTIGIPMGRGAPRSAANDGDRSGSSSGGCDCRDRRGSVARRKG